MYVKVKELRTTQGVQTGILYLLARSLKPNATCLHTVTQWLGPLCGLSPCDPLRALMRNSSLIALRGVRACAQRRQKTVGMETRRRAHGCPWGLCAASLSPCGHSCAWLRNSSLSTLCGSTLSTAHRTWRHHRGATLWVLWQVLRGSARRSA